MMQPRQLLCPAHLENLMRSFVAEEATSALRHQIGNKLAAARNGAYYIRRKLEAEVALLSSDPRLGQFLQLIDSELESLGAMLPSRLPSAETMAPAATDLVQIANDLTASVSLPEGVALHGPEGSGGRVKGDRSELMVALFCLLENAVEAVIDKGRGQVRLSISSPQQWVRLDVSDDGGGVRDEQPRPGRLGLGLRISRRIARRWGGNIELGKSEQGGGRASLLLVAA
jgi:C4-dicarboxylate-specific signal transduction histidine kinase